MSPGVGVGVEGVLWLLFLGDLGPSFVSQDGGGGPLHLGVGTDGRGVGGVGFPPGGGLGTSIKMKTHQSCCWWWRELGGDV